MSSTGLDGFSINPLAGMQPQKQPLANFQPPAGATTGGGATFDSQGSTTQQQQPLESRTYSTALGQHVNNPTAPATTYSAYPSAQQGYQYVSDAAAKQEHQQALDQRTYSSTIGQHSGVPAATYSYTPPPPPPSSHPQQGYQYHPDQAAAAQQQQPQQEPANPYGRGQQTGYAAEYHHQPEQQVARGFESPALEAQQQPQQAGYPTQSGPPSSSSRDVYQQQPQVEAQQGAGQYYSIGGQPQYQQGEAQYGQQYGTGEVDYSGMSTMGGDLYSTGGTMTGEGRLVSVTSRVDESRSHVLGEEFIEHEIRVPRRVVREEVYEKVIVVPETRRTEEIVEDTCMVRERVIKVARPTVVERVIEVPEIVWVDKEVVGPSQTMLMDKLREVERVIWEEREVVVPKVIPHEVCREVVDDSLPPIYQDRPVDKEVVVYDWRDEIVIDWFEVPKYVDKPVKVIRDVEVVKDIQVDMPLPIEAEVTYEFTMPHLQPNFHKVTYPVYLPRFIEVPVAAELLTPHLNMLAEDFRSQIKALENGATTSSAGGSSTGGGGMVTPVSLQEIEDLATKIMRTDFQTQLQSVDLQSAVMNAWNRGHLEVKNPNTGSIGGGDLTYTKFIGMPPPNQSSSEGPPPPYVMTTTGGSTTVHSSPPQQSYQSTLPQGAYSYNPQSYNQLSSYNQPPPPISQTLVPIPTQLQQAELGRRPSFNPLYPMSQSGVKTQAITNRNRPKAAAY